jgi:mannose-6-phosphate isomerase-like protein (cupin superfamily)
MNTTMNIQLKPLKGNSIWVLGDLYTFKITGKETMGAFTVIEQVIQREGGPPPHIHRREDELFYVLEGKFSFMCGDKSDVFESGSFIYIPKNTLHTFKNIGDKQGRLLVTISPAGLEEFFYSIGTPASESASSPGFDPNAIEKVMKLAPDYQMDIVLPSQNN